MKIGIIGSGMTGLSCARHLAAGGLATEIIDKGRGMGGRLSTRRAGGALMFDHGAQYLSVTDPSFKAMLGEAVDAGAAAEWPDPGATPVFVGMPGMSGIAKHLGAGLNIRQSTEALGIKRYDRGWDVMLSSGEVEKFDQLVMTVPAPQTMALLEPNHPISRQIRLVQMEPCLTLMLALPAAQQTDFAINSLRDGPIRWISRDSDKPGRDPATNCWIAHASTEWSREHLEIDKEAIAPVMLPLVADHLEIDADTALYVAAHRWRYAMASQPLEAPFVVDGTGSLYAGGDWCLGDSAEDAWRSGRAIAEAILKQG